MNTLKIITWSERQQVLAVILMAGVLIFVLWLFALTPLNTRQRQLEKRIESMRTQLAAKNYYLGEEALRSKKDDALKANRALHDEWVAMTSRLSAFSNYEAVAQSPVGHIDFKVALFDVRQRLLRKSRALNISLPHDLGMDAKVHSDEDARKLMLQLRTVEKLVDLALDLKINMLRNIFPRPQVLHKLESSGEPFIEEYPVEIEFSGTLANLYDLFNAVLEPNHVFVIRQLRVEAASPSRPDFLNVYAVLSGLVFLKDPDEMAMTEKKAVAPPRPKGE
jgi:Tfp pilus assembly protein PilO